MQNYEMMADGISGMSHSRAYQFESTCLPCTLAKETILCRVLEHESILSTAISLDLLVYKGGMAEAMARIWAVVRKENSEPIGPEILLSFV
jgi:hypothetical protein